MEFTSTEHLEKYIQFRIQEETGHLIERMKKLERENKSFKNDSYILLTKDIDRRSYDEYDLLGEFPDIQKVTELTLITLDKDLIKKQEDLIKSAKEERTAFYAMRNKYDDLNDKYLDMKANIKAFFKLGMFRRNLLIKKRGKFDALKFFGEDRRDFNRRIGVN